MQDTGLDGGDHLHLIRAGGTEGRNENRRESGGVEVASRYPVVDADAASPHDLVVRHLVCPVHGLLPVQSCLARVARDPGHAYAGPLRVEVGGNGRRRVSRPAAKVDGPAHVAAHVVGAHQVAVADVAVRGYRFVLLVDGSDVPVQVTDSQGTADIELRTSAA